jgi:hypothetical protein
MIASTADGGTAAMGEVLKVEAGKTVSVTVRFRDPEGNNGGGHQPTVARVDLIVGRSDGTVGNTNPTARVAARFYPEDWALNGEWHSFTWQTKAAASGYYVRVRGTSTDELEPLADEPHEDPWGDLWFYSNPVFISQTSNGN